MNEAQAKPDFPAFLCELRLVTAVDRYLAYLLKHYHEYFMVLVLTRKQLEHSLSLKTINNLCLFLSTVGDSICRFINCIQSWPCWQALQSFAGGDVWTRTVSQPAVTNVTRYSAAWIWFCVFKDLQTIEFRLWSFTVALYIKPTIVTTLLLRLFLL